MPARVAVPAGLSSPWRDPFRAFAPIPVIPKIPDEARSGAVFSRCGRYRYLLYRAWGRVPENYPVLLFIMLNPSTADAELDDATIRKCLAYAKRWGYFRLAVINLFAFRATDPSDLLTAPDPIGPKNMDFLAALGGLNPTMAVCAWGRVPARLWRQEARARMALRETGRVFHYLRLNQNGSPAHPLYLPAKLEPVSWLP